VPGSANIPQSRVRNEGEPYGHERPARTAQEQERKRKKKSACSVRSRNAIREAKNANDGRHQETICCTERNTLAVLPTSTMLGRCANGNSAHRALWVSSSLVTMLRTTVCSGAAILRRATPRRRIKMKATLVIAVLLLALFISGCNVNPAPAATVGPAGPPGPAGTAGQAGQTGQTGQSGQPGDPGQSGQTGATGQAGQAGDQGQAGQTGERGRQGKDAPCPAGEHRYTNADTGKVSCVRD
jgi:hypothetical protein